MPDLQTVGQHSLLEVLNRFVNRFSNKIKFYNIDPENFAVGSPLEGFWSSEKLEQSMNRWVSPGPGRNNNLSSNILIRFVHSADALRLLLIERYGGFYADSDFVILKSLKELRNVVASDQVGYFFMYQILMF